MGEIAPLLALSIPSLAESGGGLFNTIEQYIERKNLAHKWGVPLNEVNTIKTALAHHSVDPNGFQLKNGSFSSLVPFALASNGLGLNRQNTKTDYNKELYNHISQSKSSQTIPMPKNGSVINKTNPATMHDASTDTNTQIGSTKITNTSISEPLTIQKMIGKSTETSGFDTNSAIARSAFSQTQNDRNISYTRKNPTSRNRGVNTNFVQSSTQGSQSGKPGNNQRLMYAQDYHPSELPSPLGLPPPEPTDRVIVPSKFHVAKMAGTSFGTASLSPTNAASSILEDVMTAL